MKITAIETLHAAGGNRAFDFLKISTAPWYYDFVTFPPLVQDGQLTVPTGPGGGTEVNEETIRAHPYVGRNGVV